MTKLIGQNETAYLNTRTLILRPLLLSDAAGIAAIRSDERVNRFTDNKGVMTSEEALRFIQRVFKGIKRFEVFYWAITLKNTHTLIGTICLWDIDWRLLTAETGFELHPDHEGKGYMQEAIHAVISYGFDLLNLRRIRAYTKVTNIRAIRSLEKQHFERDHAFEVIHHKQSTLTDDAVYVLQKHHYDQK